MISPIDVINAIDDTVEVIVTGDTYNDIKFIKGFIDKETYEKKEDELLTIDDMNNEIKSLNKERDYKINNVVVDNILLNPDNILKMKLAIDIYDDIEWIDINNNIVLIEKNKALDMIKRATDIIKNIYIEYRNKKNEVRERYGYS